MKVIMLDGTPDEIEKVAHLFINTNQIAIVDGKTSLAKAQPEVDPVDAIRQMLTRRPISRGQLAAYKALADGNIEYAEYLIRTNRTGSQIAGLHGALGRRINNTPEISLAGLPGNTAAVFVFSKKGDTEYIDLTPEARKALEEEGII